MRLLHVRDFSFGEHQNNSEPYAILSRRWTKSETTLADIKSGQVKLASASNKVSEFAQYVKSQFSGLDWIWVDTCCINQESAAELSEGVNCMFDWYRSATICVAYLPDVEHPSDLGALGKSIWFKRGWTLQELLASTVVVFLTTGWQVIGHKGDAAYLKDKTEVGPNIETFLAERTGIPPAVLQNFSASHSLSVEARLRWMDGRETLKEEDMSYALFGIFGVAPGANYGEKRSNAEHRLREAIDRKQRQSAGPVNNGCSWRRAERSRDRSLASPPDPSTNHDSAREQHEPDTCNWLLQHEQYKRWKAGTKQHLWLHGKPGCGKSVLCSTVIEDLQVHRRNKPYVGLAYFYFTFSDERKQSYDDLLLGLIGQFARREPTRSLLRQLYEKSRQTKPRTQELENILIFTVASFDEVFIVLDAIDESPELSNMRRILMRRLRKLVSQSSNFRLFATSRYVPDILGFAEDLPCEQIAIQPRDVSGDIQHYVAAQLSTEPRLRQFKPAVHSMIKRNVSDNADGMFRWAFLLLDQMAKLKKSNPTAIEAALKRFPRDLDDIYCRILQDLTEDDVEDALTLLRWITYAREPLSLGQLVDTLIIDLKDDTVDADNRGQPGDILMLLTSLIVTITDKDADGKSSAGISTNAATKIRLAHFTVQEYLESTRIREGVVRQFHLESRMGHYFLTQSCFSYLMHYSSSDGKESTKNKLTTYPLLEYAAESWYHHSSLHENNVVSLEMKLLESDAAMSDWLCIHKPDLLWRDPSTKGGYDPGTNLYYASYLGLDVAVKLLLEKDANVNAEGGRFGSALQAASAEGQIEVVELLLEKNANVNAEGGGYGSALQAGSAEGQVEVVKLLLDKDANVNAEEGYYGSALQAASAEGQIEVVKLLLDKDANVNAEGGEYGSALQAASWGGHFDVVKLLLEKNANVNAEGGYYGNALESASREGHLEVVKLILEKNANVNAQGGNYGSALKTASVGGHVEVTELLLERNANVNAEGGGYGSALQAASYGGHVEVVKLLLRKGADVNAEGGHYGSALQAASREGHLEVIKLLVEKSANVNVEGGDHGSALQAASARGQI